MSLPALILVIYFVFIPISFITCVAFNWHEGDDLTLKGLVNVLFAAIIPIINIYVVIIVLINLFNVSNVADKVLIKGRNKNEPS